MKVKAKDVAAYGISGAAGGLLLQSFIGIAAGVTVYEVGKYLHRKISQNNTANRRFLNDEFIEKFSQEFLSNKETLHYTEKYAEYLDERSRSIGVGANLFSHQESGLLQTMAYKGLLESSLNKIYRAAYGLKGKDYSWKIARGFAMGAARVIKQDDSKQHLHFFFALAAMILQQVYNLSRDDSWELIKHSCQILDEQ